MAKFDSKTNTWSTPYDEPIFNTRTNLGQTILYALNQNPDFVTQISADTNVQVTSREMRNRSIRLAEQLRNLGYNENDVFAIAAKNSENVAPAIFASHLLGIPINCLEPSFVKVDCVHMLKQTKPKLIFCDLDNISVLQDSVQEIGLQSEFITFGGKTNGSTDIQDYIKGTTNKFSFESPRIEDPEKAIAVILCSSGTCGLSKPVSLPHSVFLSQRLFAFQEKEVYLSFSSLYWISGYVFLVLPTLLGGQRIITAEPLIPPVAYRVIKDYKVTCHVSSPTRLTQYIHHPDIHKADFSSVRILYVGGSILLPTVREDLVKYFKKATLLNVYGATEAGGILTVGLANDRLGYIGKLLPGIEAKIVDDDGNALPNGEQGEILARKLHVFVGYYGSPEKTKEMLDDEGWIHMGDIGYFDDEGSLFYVTRKKDILLYRNYWVSPAELEEFILKMKGVEMVAVVGVPDPVFVDLPTALVVKNEKSILTEDEIDKAITSTFSDFKRLRGGVYFVDSLPLTPSGKIRKNVLKEIATCLYKSKVNETKN